MIHPKVTKKIDTEHNLQKTNLKLTKCLKNNTKKNLATPNIKEFKILQSNL